MRRRRSRLAPADVSLQLRVGSSSGGERAVVAVEDGHHRQISRRLGRATREGPAAFVFGRRYSAGDLDPCRLGRRSHRDQRTRPGASRSRASRHRVVVSTTTRTGQQVARERFGERRMSSTIRWISPRRCGRISASCGRNCSCWPRPSSGRACFTNVESAAIPVAVVNARISDRSYPRYLRLKVLWRRILSGLAVVLAQTEEDATRLRAIGVPADRVKLGGNLKYDVRANSASEVVESIRAALAGEGKTAGLRQHARG